MNLHEQLEAGSVRWALIFPEGMPEDAKPWVVQAVRQALALDRAERERLLRERIEALPVPYSANDIDSGHRRSREHYERAVRDVLGVFDDES